MPYQTTELDDRLSQNTPLNIVGILLVVAIPFGFLLWDHQDKHEAERIARDHAAAFCAQSDDKATCTAHAAAHHKECFSYFVTKYQDSEREEMPTQDYIACVVTTPDRYFELKRARRTPWVSVTPNGARHYVYTPPPRG